MSYCDRAREAIEVQVVRERVPSRRTQDQPAVVGRVLSWLEAGSRKQAHADFVQDADKLSTDMRTVMVRWLGCQSHGTLYCDDPFCVRLSGYASWGFSLAKEVLMQLDPNEVHKMQVDRWDYKSIEFSGPDPHDQVAKIVLPVWACRQIVENG